MKKIKIQPNSCKPEKNTTNIMYVIHPTEYGDFDCLAIGDCKLLLTLVKENEHFHFIKKSKFGGIPVLVMDTCDTLRDALSCIK